MGSVDLQRVWAETTRRYPYLSPIAPFKNQLLYDTYAQHLGRGAPVRNLLELGIYRGGSLILWREALRCRVIGVDLDPPPDTMPLVERWLDESSARESVFFHWRTDQADEEALRGFIGRETDGPLDVVIDDASHLLGPTRRSFETLFPLLRPGGLYVIEDWRAGRRPEFRTAEGTVDAVLKEILDGMRDSLLPVESMLVKIGAAITACALIVKAALAPTPALVALVPERASAGRSFNLQPDGTSAITVRCANATRGTVIVFGGVPLATTFGSSDLLTGLVPPELYAAPASTDVWLRHPGESEHLQFDVEVLT